MPFSWRFAAAALLILTTSEVAASPAGDAALRAAKAFGEGRFREAAAIVRPFATGQAPDAAALYWAGRAALELRDPTAAVQSLETAAALDPSSFETHLWLARALSDEAKEGNPFLWILSAHRIRNEIERAIELDPRSPEARLDRVRYLVMAPGFLGGSVREAVEEAAAIAKLDRARGRFARGYIHYREKEHAAAERELAAAVSLDSSRAEPYLWLGWLAQETRQYSKAFETWSRLRTLDPRSSAAYEIGRTAMFSGERLAEGAAAIEEYLRREPGRGQPSAAEAHYVLGKLHQMRGFSEKARAEYRTALRLDRDLSEAKAALKELDRARN